MDEILAYRKAARDEKNWDLAIKSESCLMRRELC